MARGPLRHFLVPMQLARASKGPIAPSRFGAPLSLLQGTPTWLSSAHLSSALSLGLGCCTLPGPSRLPEVSSSWMTFTPC